MSSRESGAAEGGDMLPQNQEDFERLWKVLQLLLSDTLLQEEHGFRIGDYLDDRYEFGQELGSMADNVERVDKTAGKVKTAGGTAGVTSGALTSAGISMAPVSGGTSMLLTGLGIGSGLFAAGASLASRYWRDSKVKDTSENIKDKLEQLQERETVLRKLFQELQSSMTTASQRGLDSQDLNSWKLTAATLMLDGYNGVKSFETVREVWRMLESIPGSDCWCLMECAEGVSAPGFGAFGKMWVTAGSQSAKLLSRAMSAINVVSGICDIRSGLQDMNGSEQAKAYRDFREAYDADTTNLAQWITLLRSKFGTD